jgi:beta-galactosidase
MILSNPPSLPSRPPFDLKVSGRQFLRDGQPHRIFSGALHYFRVVPEYWQDRILKYRAMGLNTIETYVAWNLHETRPGAFSFGGTLDLRRFISLAGDLGMDVILRPGPYICAEWDLGGLPAWLLADRSMKLRTLHPGFLLAVARYFDAVAAQVSDLQCTKGGPIVAVQIENEYGSYGNSQPYLRWLEQALIDRGIDTLLFTSDGPQDSMLQGGTLPHILKTVNFGSRSESSFAKLREYEDGPLMCMEFWNGWFDHWGAEHHVRDSKDAVATLEEMLGLDASVNFYMAHGGTNFGFMNGANHDGKYLPTVTSYDYDAPIDEQGRLTPKYFAFQKLLARHGARLEEPPAPIPTASFGEVSINASLHLFEALDVLSNPIRSEDIPAMEDIGQNHGFIFYRTFVSGPRPSEKLFLQDVHDRALVFQDGALLKIVDRNDIQDGIAITIPATGSRIEILVANLGRVNYGSMLHDRKGITVGARLNFQFLSGWDVFPLEFLKGVSLPWQNISPGKPATFYRGSFDIEYPYDTFLRIDGAHGIAWINNFCLGWYWNIGPQKTLYVPAPVLKNGRNEIVIFEFEGDITPRATFQAESDLGETIKTI